MTEDLRPPFRQQFDSARDPYTARNALGIPQSVISGGGGGGGGAPIGAEYIVSATDPTLTAERVLTNTATITWDFTTPGQAKASTAASGGNVSNSGTPTLGQYAKWVTATTIQGVSSATVLGDIGAQPLDATLTALAAYNTNGLLTQTAADTFTGRTLTGPAAGITVSNGDGVAGNPTLALANDLASLEAASATNAIYYRSAADTWAPVTVSTGLAFSGGNLTSTVAGGGVTRLAIVAFKTNGTWTKNANLIGIVVEVWGGGGGGAVAITGGGGAGGGYARKWYLASALGSTVTVTIGAGGGIAANGSTTTFAATAAVSASGGGGASSGGGGTGSGGDENLTGTVGNTGIAGATIGVGGTAPLLGIGTVGGGTGYNAPANSGGGGTSGNTAGGSGYCRVTEYYSI